MIFDFFIHKHECKHTHVPVDIDQAYCPDCGALIKNKWYIVRCCCCDIKRAAHIEYDDIKPDTKFCPNCGGTEFYVEELNSLNFTDIKYAIFKKIVIKQENFTTRQIWIEKEENLISEKKLIGLSNIRINF